MAQVKKFQSGGKTFKINGKTYNTSNSDDMKRLEEMASDSNYGGIAQQILSDVNNANYDNSVNVYRTADGRVVYEGGLQETADQYMTKGTQKATQRKDNAINNAFKRRSGKEWINNLDSFLNNFDKKSTTSTSTSSDNKIKISGVSGLGGKWEYDDQGLWNEANINNNTMLRELQLLEQYYNDSQTLSKEDLDKKYDVSGLNKQSLDTYIEMRKSNPNLYSQYSQYFTPNGKFLDNDDFYSTYGWFGFSQDPDAKKASDTKALKEYLATQGLDFDGAENVFYRDKDGNLMVTDAFLTNVIGGNRAGNYWLNDNWANLLTEDDKPNPYAQMRNHIIWNGRVYKQDDAEVLNNLKTSGYIAANEAYDAVKAENIMRTQWSKNPSFAHTAFDYDTKYSDWAQGYKDKGLRYRSLEGNDAIKEGEELIGYYTDNDTPDKYGYRAERYAIVGTDGKIKKDNVDPNLYAKKDAYGNYVVGTASFMQDRLGEDAGILAGTYIDGTSVNGKPSNTFFYQNPDTGEFFIQDPDLKGVQKGKAVRIPKEIAEVIPEEAWEYFRTNKDAKDRLFRKIRNFTNTGFGKKMGKVFTLGLSDSAERMLRNDFRKAIPGLSKEDADKIVQMFNDWGTNKYYREKTGGGSSAIDRQHVFLGNTQTEDLVQPFKEGGKIEKHQYGKVLGQQGKTESKKINVTESNRKDASTGQSIGFGSKDSKQWSSLDTMELIGASADLAALGITIADPTNIGGAIAGAAGSLTNFGVDIKRDGFQGKDLGRLGLNLLLDVGTLVPVLGDALQGKKAISAMKRVAPILSKAIKAGAIVGVGDAVYNTIDKIAKGESFTISDVRRIINGISGGITLSRTGLLNQTKRRIDVDPGLIIKGKPNSGVADIKLSKEQIKKIADAPKAEQMKTLTDILKKAGHDVDKLDLDSVAKTIKSPQWRFWKGWSKTAVPDISKGGSKRVKMTEADLNKLAKERNGFQNWFFGTGSKYRNSIYKLDGPEFLEHNVPIGQWTRRINVAPNDASASFGERYRFIPTWAPTTIRHRNPARIVRVNPWTMPNVVSTQQFPQETQWTEGVKVVPMKRLVFKEGGVLKGEWGIPSALTNLLKNTNVDYSKLGTNTTPDENGVMFPTLDVVGKAKRSTLPAATEYKPIGTQTVSTNYASDHAYGSGNETKATKQVGDYWKKKRATVDMGGRPSGENDFEWGYFTKELAGIGNSLAARMDAKKFLDQSNKKADIYSKGQPSIWNSKGRMRFQTPTLNLVNQQIAANNTIAGMMNTSDAQANIAGKLSLAETNSKLFNQGVNAVSQEFSNHLNKYDAQRREDDKLTFETANNAKQWAMNTGLMRNAGETEYITNMGAIRDKDFVKIQSDINRFGMIDAQKQSMIDKLNLQRNTPGLTTNQITAIDNQIAQIKSPEYNNILRRQAMYGSVASAKKGTKLRSTVEQMLLDNNKLVAKAISKLSDNTMKLILRAMS